MKVLPAWILASAFLAQTFTAAPATAGAGAEAVLTQQAEAWNQGDLTRFVASYAPHCTIVGRDISELTRAQVLAHYRQKYSSPRIMGKLTFSGLTVHPVAPRVVTVTGHWHLDRLPDAGGPVGGVFSLVCERVGEAWQIILDHTS